MTDTQLDPIPWHRIKGLIEAAAILQVEPQTVRHWRSNLNIFLEPDAVVSGRPLWDVWRIVQWGVDNGKLTLEPVE